MNNQLLTISEQYTTIPAARCVEKVAEGRHATTSESMTTFTKLKVNYIAYSGDRMTWA